MQYDEDDCVHAIERTRNVVGATEERGRPRRSMVLQLLAVHARSLGMILEGRLCTTHAACDDPLRGPGMGQGAAQGRGALNGQDDQGNDRPLSTGLRRRPHDREDIRSSHHMLCMVWLLRSPQGGRSSMHGSQVRQVRQGRQEVPHVFMTMSVRFHSYGDRWEAKL